MFYCYFLSISRTFIPTYFQLGIHLIIHLYISLYIHKKKIRRNILSFLSNFSCSSLSSLNLSLSCSDAWLFYRIYLFILLSVVARVPVSCLSLSIDHCFTAWCLHLLVSVFIYLVEVRRKGTRQEMWFWHLPLYSFFEQFPSHTHTPGHHALCTKMSYHAGRFHTLQEDVTLFRKMSHTLQEAVTPSRNQLLLRWSPRLVVLCGSRLHRWSLGRSTDCTDVSEQDLQG